MNIKKKNTHKVISINLKNKQSRKKNHNSYIFETNPFIFNHTPRERIMYGGLPSDTSDIVFDQSIDLPDNLNFDVPAIKITNENLKKLADKYKQGEETITLDKKYQMVIVIQKSDQSYKLFEVNYQKMRKDLGNLSGGAPPFFKKKSESEKRRDEIKRLEKEAEKEQKKREKREEKEKQEEQKKAEKEEERRRKDEAKNKETRFNYEDSMKRLQDLSESLIKKNTPKEGTIKATLDILKGRLNKEYPKGKLRTNWIPKSVLEGYESQLKNAVGKLSGSNMATSLIGAVNDAVGKSPITNTMSIVKSSASTFSNLLPSSLPAAGDVVSNITSAAKTTGMAAIANSTPINNGIALIKEKLGITADISEIFKGDNIKELLSKGINVPEIINKMIEKINEKKKQLTADNISTIASDIATNSDINLGGSIPLITALLKALPQKELENISKTEEPDRPVPEDNNDSQQSAVSNSETEVDATGPEQSISVNAEESEDNDSVYIFDIYKIEYPSGQNFIKISFDRLDLNEKGFVNVIETDGNFKIIQGDFQNYLSELINNEHRIIICEGSQSDNEQSGGYLQIGGGFKLPVSKEELERRRTKMITSRDEYQTSLVRESEGIEVPKIETFGIEAGNEQQEEESGDEKSGDEEARKKQDEVYGVPNEKSGQESGTDENAVKSEKEGAKSQQRNIDSKSDSKDSPDSNNSSGDLETRVANLESLVSGLKNQLGIEPSDSTKCVNVTVPESNGSLGNLENTDAQVKHKNMVRLSRILRLMEDNNTETLYNFIKGSDNNYEWVPTGNGNHNLCNLDLLLQRLIVLSALPLNNKEKMLFSAILKNLDEKPDSSGGDKLAIMLETFGIKNN